jgi:hypothetical protein
MSSWLMPSTLCPTPSSCFPSQLSTPCGSHQRLSPRHLVWLNVWWLPARLSIVTSVTLPISF